MLCGYDENYRNSWIVCRQSNVLQSIISDHISPVVKELHWLPISKRREFKILIHIFNSLKQTVPSYLANLISPYIPGRLLRSIDSNLLPPKKFNTKPGQAAFENTGAFLWNRLPFIIRKCDSVTDFLKSCFA